MRRLALILVISAMIVGATGPAKAETVQWAATAEASSAYGASATPEGVAQSIIFYLLGPADVLVGPAFAASEVVGPALSPSADVALCTLFSQNPCVPGDPAAFVDETAAGASMIPDRGAAFAAGLPDTVVDAATGLPDAAVNTLTGLPAAIEQAQKGSSWSKEQATGAPDTYPRCGDIGTAWAPQSSGSDPESITLSYSPAVANAKRIDIYETNVGGFVTSVVVTLGDGTTQTVFSGPDTTACPGILSINLTGNPTIQAVKVNTQASGWEEIDAVGIIS